MRTAKIRPDLSLQKQPFLLPPRRWGRFAKRPQRRRLYLGSLLGTRQWAIGQLDGLSVRRDLTSLRSLLWKLYLTHFPSRFPCGELSKGRSSSSCPANITVALLPPYSCFTENCNEISNKKVWTRLSKPIKRVGLYGNFKTKSQSLVIIFAATSSLAAKPQNATSEGNSPRRKRQPRSEHYTEIRITCTAKPVSEYRPTLIIDSYHSFTSFFSVFHLLLFCSV